MGRTRTFNSIRNTLASFMSQGIFSLASFVCRTVFIHTLGRTYLGLSGLFSDVLSLLSLAELGFGTAIIYFMYKPVAEGNEKRVSALLNLYRRVYTLIGIIITISGLGLLPFLSFFISDIPDIPELPLIYILYLLNTSCSYFFIYKKSILTVNQDNYVYSIIYTVCVVLQNIIQMIVLVLFHNFILYLLIQIVFTIILNLIVSIYVDRHYPYLKKYRYEKLDQMTKNEILINIKAMFLSKVSSAIVTSTDNLLISKFVSTIILGYYSNYTLFISLIRTIFIKAFESIAGSVGNLVAIESNVKSRETFKKIFFINFWMIGVCSVCMFVLINPFIEIWIGGEYLLSTSIIFFICLNLYMRLIRNTQLTYIDTYGLFVDVKWKCMFEAIINIVTSLILLIIFDMGIIGVLLGTFISNITTNFWYEPYLIYHKKFKTSVREYFKDFIQYFIVTFMSGIILYFICKTVHFPSLLFTFIIKCLICFTGINMFYYFFFRKKEEYKYFSNMIIKKIVTIQ